MSISIKHAGKVYSVAITDATTIAELKSEIEQLTKVPTTRQKIMLKAKDTDLVSAVTKPNQTVMVLGTPDEQLVKAPAQKQVFMEDLDPSNFAQLSDDPIGLQNLGNTCYLNASIQALFQIDSLKDVVLDYKPTNANDPEQKLVAELGTVFRNLRDKPSQSVMPLSLLAQLRRMYPQFDERDPQSGMHKQQDAEEVYTQIVQTLKNVLGDLGFGIELKSTIKNMHDEGEAAQEKAESDVKLSCHITGATNFMKNGLIESLSEVIEKKSPQGIDSEYQVSKKITKLPRYLTVQYVRFFWKKSTAKKSKILRKVAFPFQLDLADMLDESIVSEKVQVREALRAVEKEKYEHQREMKKQKLDTAMTPKELFEHEKAVKESAHEKWLNEYKSKFPEGLSKGENPSSLYELTAIVTHAGANSESGHYQAFVKDKYDDDKWYKFNDDKVTVIEKEKIEMLAGGGESDSGLIFVYKGFGLE